VPLRNDLLLRPQGDTLQVLDLILEQEHSLPLTATESDAGVPPQLLEGPMADALRLAAWGAKVRPCAPQIESGETDWSEAVRLPAAVAPGWRDPERWRRLRQDRLAGAPGLVLRSLLTESALAVFDETPLERFETELVQANKAPVEFPLFSDPSMRRMLGGLLGLVLPARTHVNRWQLLAGDFMKPHRDGRHYLATFSLGLSRDWTAADSGAIAFGQPHPDGFTTEHRFLPHRGDLVLFQPTIESWHQVEPPARTRDTVTGWWMA
jgi:hypothetical protein